MKRGLKSLIWVYGLWSMVHGLPFVAAQEIVEPPRAMWVWDVNIPQSKDATKKIIEFCKSRNINRLYLSASNFGEQNARNYRLFNQAAHASGIFTHALAGDPRWGLERYHQQSLRWVEEVLSFNRASRPAERFDGIQNDTEIYLLGKPWEDSKEQVLKEYLDLNKKITELRTIEESEITYACDIPFWYDDDPTLIVNWNGKTQPPSFHILDTADSATIMDYRNFAEGPNGSIALAKKEVEYAASVNKKVYIGQETNEGVYPEYLSFAGMDEAAMETEIHKLAAAYAGNKGFGGIAIHHYESYLKLVEKK
ncbi:MAG: hypothetical protein PHO42_01750 [Candidatus Omnitrophica bacterium]|nr:hypothetical protein [Candidatus Omnitrophota bacterium]